MSCKKAKGKRAKTRHKFSGKGAKLTVNRLLQEFKDGQKVTIKANASLHSGFPPRRYQGRVGVVAGKQGSALKVSVSQGREEKQLLIHPAHLVALKA